jgi:hypothetical protein
VFIDVPPYEFVYGMLQVLPAHLRKTMHVRGGLVWHMAYVQSCPETLDNLWIWSIREGQTPPSIGWLLSGRKCLHVIAR